MPPATKKGRLPCRAATRAMFPPQNLKSSMASAYPRTPHSSFACRRFPIARMAPEAAIVDIRYEIDSSNPVLAAIEGIFDVLGFHSRQHTVRYRSLKTTGRLLVQTPSTRRFAYSAATATRWRSQAVAPTFESPRVKTKSPNANSGFLSPLPNRSVVRAPHGRRLRQRAAPVARRLAKLAFEAAVERLL